MIVPFMFIFVSNLGVILSISLSLLYRSQVQERARMKDSQLPIYQGKFMKSATISAILIICWGLLMYSPRLTNEFYFL